MNDEVITISSDTPPARREFIQCCYNDKSPSIVTINSESTFIERVPISWPEPVREKTYTTPTAVQKVNKWINDSVVNLNMAEEDLISLRSNFSKSPSLGSSKSSKSSKKKDTVKYQRLLRSKSVESSKIAPKKRLLSKYIVKEEFVATENINSRPDSTSNETYNVPLSPESQKKELYHYLKLMDPADKKEILLIQNRRSTRVKNLNLMQEKKEQDKKMRESEQEIMNGFLNGHTSPEPTMKSFKDLNIKAECFQDSSSSEDESDSEDENLGTMFKFPDFPESKVNKNVMHFDTAIRKVLYNIKRSYGSGMEDSRNKLEELLIARKNSRKLMNSNKENKYLLKKKTNNNGRIDKLRLKKIAKKKMLNKHLENIKKNKNYPKKKSKPPEKTKILRSTGKLKNTTIKKLINTQINLKKQKKLERKQMKTSICEIVPQNDNSNVDLENIIDDIVDFSRLSDEHKRCLLESRFLSNKSMATALKSAPSSSSGKSGSPASPFRGYSRSEVMEVSPSKNDLVQTAQTFEEFEKKFNKSIEEVNGKKIEVSEEKIQEVIDDEVEMKEVEDSKSEENQEMVNIVNGCTENEEKLIEPVLGDHDYTNLESSSSDSENEEEPVLPPKFQPEIVSPPKKTESTYAPFRHSKETLSLHRSLTTVSEKKLTNGLDSGNSAEQSWESFTQQKNKNDSHSIFVNKDNGVVLKAFYINKNLIVTQEFLVSLWTQSALGNVLAAQNMWIPKGNAPRIVLNNRSTLKDSLEMVFCQDTTVAYVELWIKEHKSEIRQGPVADVFATVYFWKKRQNGLEKKVLQIENINGFADDVQYVVLKNAATIIVSWHSVSENNKITLVHKYCLASDFATVANTEMQSVTHYVSSLHNIEDCESMIIGCGENKITLWNIEHGYIVSTIEMNDIRVPLSTLWVKCDQGFLFTIQQCVNRELRLIAINGFNNTWKKLQSFVPPEGYDRLNGVVLDEGFIISFYDSGILCWKAQTAEPIQEDNAIRNYIPSGNHIIIIEDEQIIVKNALAYLLES